MARYIENLTSCTDPTSGDYLWISDANGGADRDRKLDVGLFPRLDAANTFTAAQTIRGDLVVGAVGANAIARVRTPVAIDVGVNGTLALPAFVGFVMVMDDSGGGSGLFGFVAAATVELLDTNGLFTAILNNAGTINCYYSGGYFVQNKTAVTRSVRVICFGG